MPSTDKVWTLDEFDYAKVSPGALVTAEGVMNAMNCMPPACMRLNCAQMGEAYSHSKDPETGHYRATYATFKVIEGNFSHGTWVFCGYCFRNETEERGEEPPYVRMSVTQG